MKHQDPLVVNLSACGVMFAFAYSKLTFLAIGFKDVFAAKNNRRCGQR